MAKGMYQEAFDITQKGLSFYEGNVIFLSTKICIYALSGQTEKAKEMFDDFRSDPRYKALLKRMNLE